MAVEISDDVELAAVGLVAPEIGIRLIARKKGEAAAGAYLRDLMVKVGNVNGIASGDGIFANAADKLAAGFHVGEAVNGGVDLVHHGLLNNDVDMHKNRLLSHEMTYYRYPAVVDVAGELNAVLYYRKRAESCVDTLGLDRSVADGVLSYPHYSGGTLPVGDAGIGHIDHGQCLKESRYEVGDAGTGTIMPTRMVILYKVFPPVVFVMSILFNQIAIRYFNHLMSHTEYVPIVNTKGDVIGRSLAIEALNYKNAYINPVIRIAVSTHGMLFLCDRPMNAILDKGKTDIPMECYLRYGESLTEGVNRLVNNALPHATEDFKPEFNIVYHFENETTNRLIYLFIVDIKDDSILCTPRFKNSKLWSFKQIEENMGKGFFSSCFEDEYEHLKDVICIREKYRES